MLASAILRLSSLVASLERALLVFLVAALALLVLTNVLLRGIGITIAWADELAVYSMILSGFVGASLMLRGRVDPAVFLLHELSTKETTRILKLLISLVCVCFGLILIYTTWRWFDPLALIAAGFDVAAFEVATFNFVYTDVTPIMGIPTFWFYLIMPWFGLTVTIHASANLMEDIGLIERPKNPAKIDATEI